MHEKAEYITILCKGQEVKIKMLEFGELRITMHEGKVKYVDSTERQKVD